jgi:hypothetical protein
MGCQVSVFSHVGLLPADDLIDPFSPLADPILVQPAE